MIRVNGVWSSLKGKTLVIDVQIVFSSSTTPVRISWSSTPMLNVHLPKTLADIADEQKICIRQNKNEIQINGRDYQTVHFEAPPSFVSDISSCYQRIWKKQSKISDIKAFCRYIKLLTHQSYLFEMKIIKTLALTIRTNKNSNWELMHFLFCIFSCYIYIHLSNISFKNISTIIISYKLLTWIISSKVPHLFLNVPPKAYNYQKKNI